MNARPSVSFGFSLRTPCTAIALAIALALPACVADAAPMDEGSVVVLSAEELQEARVEVDRIVAPGDATWAKAVRRGDVLMAETGLLRRVTDVFADPETVEILTEHAALEDAVDELHVEQESGGGGKGDEIDLDLGIHLERQDVELWRRGDAYLVLREAHFDLEPVLDVELDLAPGQPVMAQVKLGGQVDAGLLLEAGLDVQVEEHFEESFTQVLFESEPQIYVQWVNFVPVVERVVMRVHLDVVFRADAAVGVTVGAEASGRAVAGVRYEDRMFESASEMPSFRFDVVGPDLELREAEVRVDASLRPELDIRFYETAGLQLGFDLASSVRADAVANECDFASGVHAYARGAILGYPVGRDLRFPLRESAPRACFE